MTWRTQLGDRILQGAEAALYLNAMQHAVEYLQEMEELEADIDVLTGDRIFDGASFQQRIALLHTCLSALLQPDFEVPEVTSVLEAAAYFPFAFLKKQIEEEIESEKEGIFEDEKFKYYYRRLTWSVFEEFIRPSWESAVEEFGQDEEEAKFSDRSTNLFLWNSVIDEMVDRIFWDRDWTISSFAPQLLDGIEETLSQSTDLTEGYLINRLPKVSTVQAEEALSAICGWKIPS
jgi:hypothetical protein